MGTSFSIKISSYSDHIPKKQLKLQIDAVLDGINQGMSTYQEDSEISRFNQSSSIDWQQSSADLISVLVEANKISRLTQGAFDVTVGPLVNLWGFGPDPRILKAPEKNKIKQALNQIGYKKLLIDKELPKIKKTIPDLYLDLSALAKGYAVDEVAELLEKHGFLNYLIEIGGELRLRGKNINGNHWRIGIEKPVVNGRFIQKVLPVTDISMATSGDYRNYFEDDGVRFSHTIDPRTGRPITHKLASVTVFSDSAMEADALATAMMVLGPAEGFDFAELHKIAAYFIIKKDDDFKEQSTSAFKNLFEVKK